MAWWTQSSPRIIRNAERNFLPITGLSSWMWSWKPVLCLPTENIAKLWANLPKSRLLFRSHTASNFPQLSQHQMEEDGKYITKKFSWQTRGYLLICSLANLPGIRALGRLMSYLFLHNSVGKKRMFSCVPRF